MSVLIVNGRCVLLARRAIAPCRGYWDIVGGFVDPGETAEQAARREAREELGTDVVLQRLLGILPGVYGPDREPVLNICYVGRLEGSTRDLTPQDDIAAVAWFPLNRLPRKIAFDSNRRALRLLGNLRGSRLVAAARPGLARPGSRIRTR